MCTNRTIIALSVFSLALGAYAQPVCERLAGTEQTEVQHTELRHSLPVDPESMDSLVEVRMLEVRTYMDTIRSIEQREYDIIVPPDSSDRRGHYVQFHVGAGIGNTGYGWLSKDYVLPQAKGGQKAALSGVVQLQYAYSKRLLSYSLLTRSA